MVWDLSWAFIALLDEPDIREFTKSLAALKLDVELCCLFFFSRRLGWRMAYRVGRAWADNVRSLAMALTWSRIKWPWPSYLQTAC